MRNLLSIEEAFLNMPQVKEGLNLAEIRSLNRAMTNGQKKKFGQTLQMSKLVLKSFEWFNSDEAKQILANEGLTWTTKEFSQKVFGWGKSYFYKVVRAGKLADEVIEGFNTKCDEVEREGEEANRTLEGLLKYAKQLEETSGCSGEEGDGDGEGGETADVERRVKNIFTMSFNRENIGEGNIAVRIDSNGVMKTTNTEAEIIQAVRFLESVLRTARGEDAETFTDIMGGESDETLTDVMGGYNEDEDEDEDEDRNADLF